MGRIKLRGLVPEGVTPLAQGSTLSVRLLAVDRAGRSAAAVRQRAARLTNWSGDPLTFARWVGDPSLVATRFAVLDEAGALAGFGFRGLASAGEDGAIVFALPANECLPR